MRPKQATIELDYSGISRQSPHSVQVVTTQCVQSHHSQCVYMESHNRVNKQIRPQQDFTENACNTFIRSTSHKSRHMNGHTKSDKNAQISHSQSAFYLHVLSIVSETAFCACSRSFPGAMSRKQKETVVVLSLPSETRKGDLFKKVAQKMEEAGVVSMQLPVVAPEIFSCSCYSGSELSSGGVGALYWRIRCIPPSDKQTIFMSDFSLFFGGSMVPAPPLVVTPYKKCIIINMHSVHITLRFHPRLN